jgi:flagellar secretion chaperone FliS
VSGYARNSKLAAYQGVSVRGSVGDADPHGLIQMLIDGALERLSIARGCLERRCAERGDSARKTAALHQCINIFAELRGSLDMAKGGPLAQNLSELYDYMVRRVLRATAENNVGYIVEVTSLLSEIRSAWIAIGPQVRQAAPAPAPRAAAYG